MSDELETLLKDIPAAEQEALVTRIRNRLENVAAEEVQQYRAEKEGARQGELLKQYAAEMRAAAGNKPELKRVKERFRAQGLDVDQVVFS